MSPQPIKTIRCPNQAWAALPMLGAHGHPASAMRVDPSPAGRTTLRATRHRAASSPRFEL